MSNLPANLLAELRGVETRIDQRLEILGRAENNLKTLFDALRQQVAAACPVLDQLNKLIPLARHMVQQTQPAPVDDGKLRATAETMLGIMQDRLAEQLERGKAEIEQALEVPAQELIIRASDKISEEIERGRGQIRADMVPVQQMMSLFQERIEQEIERARAEVATEMQPAQQMMTLLQERIAVQIDAGKAELEAMLAPARQQLIDELRAVVQAGKASVQSSIDAKAHAATQPELPAVPTMQASQEMLKELSESLKVEAQQTLESVRQTMMDQIELLKTDARLTIEPLLAEIEHAKLSADAQVKASVDASHSALNNRVQQLSRSVEEISSILEERLTQRVQAMQKRAGETLAAIEPILQTRMNQSMGLLEARQKTLIERAGGIVPRVEQQLEEADEQILARMARLESHAEAMTEYLEQKLSSRVEDLIQRLRLKLHHEVSAVTGAQVPEQRSESPVSPERPKLEVDLYLRDREGTTIDKNVRQNAAA